MCKSKISEQELFNFFDTSWVYINDNGIRLGATMRSLSVYLENK
jgi:hypothetical protein